ncbi:TetR family transcriptional regulator [Nocardia farcinica]|uniref:HTH-type transcriptional repressor KstR2 n=1 Tax=Nocardia farcinica TaxID=37329 RepID=A0A449GCC7_NOCFR|nr:MULTISPECIES: TetR/AcrR family transcriptional regulator [Nocardia]MBF6184456.1 TetR family transcriptional regulator [Nocardia farcinica]MBF6267442.1 TetR family transcriptional regulator [Nocardia farcinica]MBF6290434.1 TetR family transcriptional regulator [Nocardia farcinica]MBF6310300.1 TetR family transcriptional regulator [Nocardia farcinica]MBF6377607.1 TetR family transcriptional regulator [Nocardia farcinica]
MSEQTRTRRRGRPPASAAGAADTRERIVRAAVELFAEKGFHGTGVAEIGDRADVQRGALYYHIGSKEELLWQILHGYTALMLADAERITDGDDDPVAKLRKLIRSHVVLIIRHRREVAIQLRDVGALTGERAAQLQELRDRIQAHWQRVFDAGHAAGLLRTADHVVTNSVLGMLNTVTLWYRPHGGRTPAEIADILAATVLDGVVTISHTKG